MILDQTKGLWIVWIICGLKLMNSKRDLDKFYEEHKRDLDKNNALRRCQASWDWWIIRMQIETG